MHTQTSNNKLKEEGEWSESKSSGLHVLHPAAAAACRFVEMPHRQALGREIVASAHHCCGIVVVRSPGCARCAIRCNQWLVVGQDERVLLSGRCARM